MNDRNGLIALEFWRFCAHSIAVLVVASGVLLGLLLSWSLALKVTVVPLLGLLLADAMVRLRFAANDSGGW